VASAKDVTVVIPIGKDHLSCAARAQESAWESGVGGVQVLIDSHKHGVCYARNEAIGRVQTDLILPLDADDYLLPGAVERMAAAWQPGKVVYGDWREIFVLPDQNTLENHGTQLNFNPNDVNLFMHKEAPPPAMLTRKHVCHATYLFAEEDWHHVGGYDPDFNIGAEDWEFMIALVEAGCELVKVYGDSLYVKTIGDNARTNKAVRHKDIIKQLLLEKHPDFFNNPR
jgi:glycosyltransferase involved in cell wall biosynthesis